MDHAVAAALTGIWLDRVLAPRCGAHCWRRQRTPLGQSLLVMTTSAPAARQTSAMRSSSVATTTACSAVAFMAWRYVLMIMGTPRIGVRGFPGNLVDSYLAGMMPTCPAASMKRRLKDDEWSGVLRGGGGCQQTAPGTHHSCTSFSSLRPQDDDRCNSRS